MHIMIQYDLPLSLITKHIDVDIHRSTSLLTSLAFLVGDERGSWLHLKLGQCLAQLNRFAIVD